MSAADDSIVTSPLKGEVDRTERCEASSHAGGRGSRFSRTKAVTARARRLRANPTDAEQRLWQALRRGQLNDFRFRRQHPVGPYTLDFYCSSLRLAVEVDGGQHAEARKHADDRRSRWLADKDIAVVRYWNNDVLSNLRGVLEDLLIHIEKRASGLT
ncbi:MAG TPA: endonuclease domain-containing protein, partial [Bradyrhizobium sp.]|nr:endonuclease domain-containing protein [Bradyrhizobium sp.]